MTTSSDSARARAVEPKAPLLNLAGLEKTFVRRQGLRQTTVHAVRDMNLTVERGRVVALVGESGSGKSTTARLVARLIEPTRGRIELDGVDVVSKEKRPSLAYRGRVQMIFQDPFGALNPAHTIGYHLSRTLLRHRKVADRALLGEQIASLLASVGLSPAFADKHPHQASGGERQRVCIARALAVEPDLVLADEPTSMLDVSIRIGILNLLRDLGQRRSLAYLYITHDLASARYFADEIMVMYAGEVVEAGPSDDVLRRPAHPYTRVLLDAVPTPHTSLLDRPVAPAARASTSTGCLFYSRCPAAEARCASSLVPLVDVGGRRRVRCLLHPTGAT